MIEPDISPDDREYVKHFADDYVRYVRGELTLDRRRVNEVIATVANSMAESIRLIDGKVTTTRFNEKVIREVPWRRNPIELGSHQIEVDRVAYDKSGLPDDELAEEIAGWLIGQAKHTARDVIGQQRQMDNRDDYPSL